MNKYFILTCLLFPLISFIILMALCQYYHRGLFSEEFMLDCCSRGIWNSESKMRLYFPNMCLRREDMMNGVNVCFWRVFMNKRYGETCNFLFLEGDLNECCSSGSADCEGKMRLFLTHVFANGRRVIFCFLEEEANDEDITTVIVIPQDKTLPCMLFKTEKVKFYVILLMIR